MILESYKEQFAELLAAHMDMPAERIIELVEMPPKPEMGDLAFPCFSLAKTLRNSPAAVAQEIAGKLNRE